MSSQLQRFLATSLFLVVTGQTPSTAAPTFQFRCDTGYKEPDCQVQVKQLGGVLVGMDLAPLGDWTWILVRSDDWKPILLRVGRDPDSPAFTILEKRQTFLEEALFNAGPERSRTLLEKFRMPLDQLRIFAVAHELGHALCQETDETRAEAYAEQLRSTGKATCLVRSGPRK